MAVKGTRVKGLWDREHTTELRDRVTVTRGINVKSQRVQLRHLGKFSGALHSPTLPPPTNGSEPAGKAGPRLQCSLKAPADILEATRRQHFRWKFSWEREWGQHGTELPTLPRESSQWSRENGKSQQGMRVSSNNHYWSRLMKWEGQSTQYRPADQGPVYPWIGLKTQFIPRGFHWQVYSWNGRSRVSTNKNIKDCNRTFYEIISKASQLFTTIGGSLK